METQTFFLIFGIALAVFAVTISIIGLRSSNFPGKGSLIGIILAGVILVAGTGVYAVKLAKEETAEREAGDQNITGEEASVTPIRVPASFS